MKYSIILPYYNRINQLKCTLTSFRALYSERKDYEVIIVEDLKNAINPEWHTELIKIVREYGDKVKHVSSTTGSWNPSAAFNLGVENSTGEYLIISNPECMHRGNILKGLDVEFDNNPNVYVICSCLAVIQETANMLNIHELKGRWYQHSIYRNAQCHFCSAISRTQWDQIGGFDEGYLPGMCYDDDDFRNKILQAGIPIVCDDDLNVVHLSHSGDKPRNFKELHDINRRYFLNKWGEAALTAEKIPLPPGPRMRRGRR